jgi:4-carboxymuconolactone decarboxylase
MKRIKLIISLIFVVAIFIGCTGTQTFAMKYSGHNFCGRNINKDNSTNKEAFTMNKKNDNFTPVFGFGGENTLYGNHFTGKSYFKPLVEAGDPPIRMANVTFSPGCRTNWHVHTATKGGGQIIIIVDGEGWYQEAGKAPVSLKPGMVVNIPPNVKHWHGAKKNSWFAHLSLDVPGEGLDDVWYEPVSEEEYENVTKMDHIQKN